MDVKYCMSPPTLLSWCSGRALRSPDTRVRPWYTCACLWSGSVGPLHNDICCALYVDPSTCIICVCVCYILRGWRRDWEKKIQISIDDYTTIFSIYVGGGIVFCVLLYYIVCVLVSWFPFPSGNQAANDENDGDDDEIRSMCTAAREWRATRRVPYGRAAIAPRRLRASRFRRRRSSDASLSLFRLLCITITITMVLSINYKTIRCEHKKYSFRVVHRTVVLPWNLCRPLERGR